MNKFYFLKIFSYTLYIYIYIYIYKIERERNIFFFFFYAHALTKVHKLTACSNMRLNRPSLRGVEMQVLLSVTLLYFCASCEQSVLTLPCGISCAILSHPSKAYHCPLPTPSFWVSSNEPDC